MGSYAAHHSHRLTYGQIDGPYAGCLCVGGSTVFEHPQKGSMDEIDEQLVAQDHLLLGHHVVGLHYWPHIDPAR